MTHSVAGTGSATGPDPVRADLVPVSARGLVRAFAEAGVVSLAAVHVARTTCRLSREPDEIVQLGIALAVRALEAGEVSLDLDTVRAQVDQELADRDQEAPTLPWPAESEFVDHLSASPAVAGASSAENVHAVRLVGRRLYLERYWLDEQSVRRALDRRVAAGGDPAPEPEDLALARSTFPAGMSPDEHQVAAIATAVGRPTLVLAGGPGTGKTATVARMLVALQARSERTLRVALAAPSGKAAARLAESVSGELAGIGMRRPSIDPATTVHKLLGSMGPLRGFRRGPLDPLPHDVVVVDEMSMMALPLMAVLVRAIEPSTRLILVGDPMQLASVEAGSVLADLTADARAGRTRVPLVELVHNWRSQGAVADLALAIREGRGEDALEIATSGRPGVEFWAGVDPMTLDDLPGVRDRIREALIRTARAADRGDADRALASIDDQRILCAHRHGPFGVGWWARQVDDLAVSIGARPADHVAWYPGRGLLVTSNIDELGLHNGDTGVVVTTPRGLRAAFRDASGVRLLPPGLLEDIATTNAMTVHKGQGSQFRGVDLVLPPVGSPLLTRELVYTAVTRAMERISIIGDPEAFLRGVRTPSARGS